MKGYDLTAAIKREVVKNGTAGSPVKALAEDGEIHNIIEVETEEQPDGTHVLWLKLEVDDGETPE